MKHYLSSLLMQIIKVTATNTNTPAISIILNGVNSNIFLTPCHFVIFDSSLSLKIICKKYATILSLHHYLSVHALRFYKLLKQMRNQSNRTFFLSQTESRIKRYVYFVPKCVLRNLYGFRRCVRFDIQPNISVSYLTQHV